MPEGNLVQPFESLKDAITNPRLRDNQTIFLMQGDHYIYEDLTLLRSGITIRPYPGHKARIIFKPTANTFARFLVNGANCKFWGLEITSDPTNRESPTRGNHDGLQLGFISVANSTPVDGSFQNCDIDNLASCIWYTNSPGGLLYKDCSLLNNGWPTTDGQFDGEFLYTQNGISNPVKRVENVFFLPCFSVSVQAYNINPMDGHGIVNNYLFDQCTWLQSGTLYIAPGQQDATNINISECNFIETPIVTIEGESYSLTDSYFTGVTSRKAMSQFHIFNTVTQTGNVYAMDTTYQLFMYDNDTLLNPTGKVWNNNNYYGAGFSQNRTFAQWKSTTGYDLDSNWVSTFPTANLVKINPCIESSYPRIAHITVFNWQQFNTVNVDVSGLNMVVGASYRVKNVLNPKVDYTDFIYGGEGSITVQMNDRTVAQPKAYAGSWVAPDIRFGGFVLERNI